MATAIDQTPTVIYRVRNWDRHFEVAQTRKVERMQWVALPVKHDGLGYRRIMSLKNGMALYAAWVLILQVAAKCPVRGTLADEDGPLDAQDLALKTGGQECVFDEALKLLSGRKFGWLLVDRYQCDTSSLELQDRTGHNNTSTSASADVCSELAEEPDSPPTDHPSQFIYPTTGKGSKDWSLSEAKLAEYVASYPGLDVHFELRKALQWCRDNPRKRKTPGGMPAFLTSWLNRAQNRPGVSNGAAKPMSAGKHYDPNATGF